MFKIFLIFNKIPMYNHVHIVRITKIILNKLITFTENIFLIQDLRNAILNKKFV